jgi:hypothetical protein
MTLLGNTDISSEITSLQAIATSLETILQGAHVVTDPGQAAEFGQATILLGDLANLATAKMVVSATDPELPPTYGPNGVEIT